MENAQLVFEFIEAQSSTQVTTPESTRGAEPKLRLEAMTMEEPPLPEASEPEPLTSTYLPRPVFEKWEEERPSNGDVRPSYEDLTEEDEAVNE